MRDEISARRAGDLILDDVECPIWKLAALSIEPCNDCLIRRLLHIVDKYRFELRRVNAPLCVKLWANRLDEFGIRNAIGFRFGERVPHVADSVEGDLIRDGERALLRFLVKPREVARKQRRFFTQDACRFRCIRGLRACRR